MIGGKNRIVKKRIVVKKRFVAKHLSETFEKIKKGEEIEIILTWNKRRKIEMKSRIQEKRKSKNK